MQEPNEEEEEEEEDSSEEDDRLQNVQRRAPRVPPPEAPQTNSRSHAASNRMALTLSETLLAHHLQTRQDSLVF